MKRVSTILLILLGGTFLFAQNTLSINGQNEARFVYRTAEDSLNAYFSDSFSFALAYRNFSFGMKFNANLPRYPVEQSELIDELDNQRLRLAWEEFTAGYSKDAFSIQAGTTEESFGNGMIFRSYKDLEFDLDHRLDSFLLKYNEDFKFKALYGAIENPTNAGKYDLAYGADFQTPAWFGFSLGASAVAFRNYSALGYNQRDVFGARLNAIMAGLDLQLEAAFSDLYHQPSGSRDGKALFGTGSYSLGNLTLGGSYKLYDGFQYRLQDLPLANHHGETLSDSQASGEDEEGYQAFASLGVTDCLSLSGDYAEAWNSDQSLKMNDAYAALDWEKNDLRFGLSWSHIEKLNDNLDAWQQELIPAFLAGFTLLKMPVQLQGEYKLVSKQKHEVETQHAEPKLQADLSLGKLAVSLAAQSQWEEISELMESNYWPAIELKYPIFNHSDLILFGGKEAGGKVCRNGVCRYVAPFEGLKVELNTRF